MAKSFDYEAAKSAGYTDDEIGSFLQNNNPTFDVNAARSSGYSPEEINAFLSKNEPKQGGVRGFLERKVAAPAVEFGLRAAYAMPSLAKGVGSLVNKGANALIQSLGAQGLSDKELDQVGKLASAFGPFGNIPDKHDLDKNIRQATNNRLEPTTPSERMLKGGLGLIGDIVGIPGGAQAAFGTPIRKAGTAALVGVSQGLEEAGVDPLFALVAGIGADLLLRGGVGLANIAGKAARNGVKAATGELAGRTARLTPEQVRTSVVEAGERLGINRGEIPLSAQLNSPAVHGVEKMLRESSLSGRHLENQLANVETKTRTAFNEVANQISHRQSLLPGVLAEEAITQLRNVEENANRAYTNMYTEAERLLPANAVAEQGIGRTILNHVDDLIARVGRGAGTPAKDAIRNRLIRLSNDWRQRFSNGSIPIRELIELKKDLNQIIKYEVRGGADKLLNPLINMSRNAVQRYGRGNQPFAFRFNEAERMFGESARNFRKNNAVSSLLDTQNPQTIIQKMKNVRTYREIRKLFNRTPEGKQAFSDLSRYLLEDIIGSKLLNKEGKMSWGNSSGILRDPKTSEIVLEIVGTKNFNKLRDIQRFTIGIEEGLRKFANSSGSATKSFDIALILGTIGKGMAQIMHGNFIQGAKNMGLVLAPGKMAKLISDPRFVEAMADVARAGRGTDPNLFFQAGERALRFAIPAITEDYSTTGERQN